MFKSLICFNCTFQAIRENKLVSGNKFCLHDFNFFSNITTKRAKDDNVLVDSIYSANGKYTIDGYSVI